MIKMDKNSVADSILVHLSGAIASPSARTGDAIRVALSLDRHSSLQALENLERDGLVRLRDEVYELTAEGQGMATRLAPSTQGAHVSAGNVAGQDVQNIYIQPPPADAEHREAYLVDQMYSLRVQVAVLARVVEDQLCRDVTRNQAVLFGNGRRGVLSQVRDHWLLFLVVFVWLAALTAIVYGG